MENVLMIVSVAVLFIVRIGIPVLVLVSLGLLIDRWQSKRENDIQTQQRTTS